MEIGASSAQASSPTKFQLPWHIRGRFLRQRLAFQGLQIEITDIVIVFHLTTCEGFRGAI
jgi:hypothetical protein